MKKIFRRSGDGVVNASDHDCLQVLTEDGTAELHAAADMPFALHHFLPLGCKITVACHGGDAIGGHQVIELTEQKIHTVLSDGATWHAVGFAPVGGSLPAPAAPEDLEPPEPQDPAEPEPEEG